MLLTVREAAALLRVTERQVYRWVDEGEVPARRVRDQVRFNRTDLLEWATGRRLSISLEAFDADLDPEDRAPSLAKAILAGGVHLDVPATDREAALRAVVERTPMPPSVDRDFVVEVLLARERASSTAVCEGIAIPHVRQPIIAPGAAATVSVSHLNAPVILGPPSSKPVRILILIVSPTVRRHLQMLAHVARALLDPTFHAVLEQRAPAERLAEAAARLEVAAPTLQRRGSAPAERGSD